MDDAVKQRSVLRGPARDASGAIDEDLYCLGCGYNLRGLSGDPIRCPECGNDNDVGTVLIPAGMIADAMNRMETAPTTCAAMFLGLMVFLPLALGSRRDVQLTLGVGASVAIAVWTIMYFRMKREYENTLGWRGLLVQFHLAAVTCTIAIPVLVTLPALAGRRQLLFDVGTLLLVVLGTLPLILLGLKTYFQARRRMETMQRERAVRMAHDVLLRTMRQPGRKPTA